MLTGPFSWSSQEKIAGGGHGSLAKQVARRYDNQSVYEGMPKPEPPGVATRGSSVQGRRAARLCRSFGTGVAMIVAFFAAALAPCLAQDEYTRFRYEHSKIITEDPFPVRPGGFQVELEYFCRMSDSQWTDGWKPKKRGRLVQNLGFLAMAYGVARNLDIEASLGYAQLLDREATPSTGDGLTSLIVGATYLFYHDEDAAFAVAYLPSFSFPIGDEDDVDELGALFELYIFENSIVIVKDWAWPWTSNFDVRYAWFFGEGAGGSNGVVMVNAALGYQVTPWLQPVVEVSYARHFVASGGDEERVSVLGGALFLPLTSNIRIEVGGKQSVAGRNANQITSIAANISVTF